MARFNPAAWVGPAGSVFAALVPKGLCPLCLAASGSVLPSLGLGFIAEDGVMSWLLPATLAVGVTGLAWGSRRTGRWWIAGVGLAAAAVLYVGWALDVPAVLYLGMAGLFAASLANVIPRRTPAAPLFQLRKKKGPIDEQANR